MAIKCNCEHTNHFEPDARYPEPKTMHNYLAVPATPGIVASYVGEICQDCAESCIPEFVITYTVKD
jgi:hypothetical protein